MNLFELKSPMQMLLHPRVILNGTAMDYVRLSNDWPDFEYILHEFTQAVYDSMGIDFNDLVSSIAGSLLSEQSSVHRDEESGREDHA